MSATSVTVQEAPPPPQEQRELDALPGTTSSIEQPFSPGTDAPVARAKQKWNEPSINKWRILATFVSFAVVGANDGVYGALVPYIRDDFDVSTTVVSLIFVTPFAGYAVATALVNKVHMTFGQRGIAIIGPLCHIIPFLVIAIHPPFPVVLVAYAVVGLGNGLIDAAWNSWIADMVNANALVGFLNAFYGLGATLSPTIATEMINHGLRWNLYHYTLVGGSVLELIASVIMFWQGNAERFRIDNAKSPNAGGGSRTTQAAKTHVTWLMAAFLFIYMGVEVSVGGWTVEFMVQVRHGGPYKSGLIPTGFWAGVTFGRIVLGFLNEFLGERHAIAIYLALSIALELIFWLVPKFVVSAIAVSFLGFFTGPLFPGAIVVAAKLLPKHLHTAGIGIASALAGGGAAILPFIAGAISGAQGVKSLQPFILALLVVMIILWLLLPRESRHSHER